MDTLGLPADVLSEYREIFQLVDEDNSGSITASELRDLLACLDLTVDDDELQRMIAEIDSTGNGNSITFTDFLQVMMKRLDHGSCDEVKKEDLVEAFARFAKGAPAGFIYAKDLSRVLTEFAGVQEAMAKKMVFQAQAMAEPNHNDLVNYRAYIDLFLL